MPQNRRRRSDRPQQILDAAFDLFVEKGFDGTTISDVERRVGLAPGTGSLHYYFPTKQALLHAAIERHIQLRMDELEARRSGLAWPETSEARSALAAQLVLESIRQFQPLMRLLQAEGDRVPQLRESVVGMMTGAGALGSWLQAPDRMIALAALAGYEWFTTLKGGPFDLVAEEDFITALVSAIPLDRPLGTPET